MSTHKQPEFRSVIDALDHWKRVAPDREFCRITDFGGKERSMTFEELYSEALHYAEWLRSMGINKGDRVVLALPNDRRFLTSFLGTMIAGGVAVPVVARDRLLSGLRRAADALGHIFRDSAARYVLTTEENAEVCEEVLKKGDANTVISIVEKMPKKIQFSQNPLTVFPEDIAFIQYTSGSTSLPKGVVIRHHQLVAQIESIIHGLKSNAKDVVVSWLPLFHDMGLIGVFLHSLYVGMKLILMSPERFLFDPKQWLMAISKYRATMSTGPSSAYGLCNKRIRPEDMKGLDLSSWRVAFSGAEPISVNAIQAFEKRFKEVGYNGHSFVAGYGMAENCLAITFARPGTGLKYDCIDKESFERQKMAVLVLDEKQKSLTFVSCGKPVLNHEVKIVAENGDICEERMIGEVIVRGPSVMDGYFKKEAETQKTIRDSWLYTGDLGYLAEGELYITGRKKDMIIKGGRNYCPQDIEQAAQKVEGIRLGGVLAVGIYDEKQATEKIVVLAEMKPKFYKKKSNLITQIKSQVSDDMGITPDEVCLYPRGTFQRTTSGKVQRAKHKRLFLSGKLRDSVSFKDRFRYFRFRLYLLISMAFYFVGDLIRRFRHDKRRDSGKSTTSPFISSERPERKSA